MPSEVTVSLVQPLPNASSLSHLSLKHVLCSQPLILQWPWSFHTHGVPSVSAPHRQCLLRHQGTPNCSLHHLSWLGSHSLCCPWRIWSSYYSLKLASFDYMRVIFFLLLFLTALLNSLSSSFFFMPKHWGSQSLCSLWAHPWQPCHPNNLLGSLLLFPYSHGWGCFTLSYWLQHQFFPQSGMTELVLNPYFHKCGIKENMLSTNFDVFLHFRQDSTLSVWPGLVLSF